MRADQKIKRYQSLIHHLETGKSAPKGSPKYSLTNQEMKLIEKAWDEEKRSRRCAKPSEVKQYSKLLQKACFYYALMERHNLSNPKRPHLSLKYSHKADSAFEAAIGYLREIAKYSDIQMWLDRDIFGDIGWDPISIPRVIGSKNVECLNKSKTPYPILRKKDIALQVLQEALTKLENKSFEETMVIPSILTRRRQKELPDFSGFQF